MAGPEKQSKFPLRTEVKEVLNNPSALVVLGESAVNYVITHHYNYQLKWSERLEIALGSLKDSIESKTQINSSAAELSFLLLQPEEKPHYISQAEIQDIIEPTEDDAAAWAWASDLANTTRWFVAFIVLGILALIAFAVVTFGIESPSGTQTIIFLFLGSGIFTLATLILGAGLYRHFVTSGSLSWEYKGYPDAEVKRYKQFYRIPGWYAYMIGGVFLSLTIAFTLVAGNQLPFSIIPDYENVRVALLASMALGLILFAFGAWPIIRRIVFMAERDKRLGKTKYLTSPRVALTLLPILTGTLSLLLNWFFG